MFDIYWAMANLDVNVDKLLECYREYMQFVVEKPPTQKQFLMNMNEKMNDSEFLSDIHAIIRPAVVYDNVKAYELVRMKILEKI